ncbi:MAG: BamA/TamA family outer membrane protein [Candidatus Firestonebacteria bacterium]|nr:BamA/TamA family outer membrane protein [Candidatus Firestonebacteria bacterium]
MQKKYFHSLILLINIILFLVPSFIIAEENINNESLVLSNNKNNLIKSISPIFGYNPTDKFIFGGAYFVTTEKENQPGFYFETEIMSTSKSDYAIGLTYEKWRSSPYIYKISTSLSTFAWNYYGEGNNTKVEDVVEINASTSNVVLGIDYKLYKNVYTGVFFDLRNKEDDSFSGNISKDIYQKETDFGVGLSTSYDLRDNAFSTKNGHFSKLSLVFVPDQFSSDTEIKDFWQTEIDLRYFKTIFMKNVIAGRFSGGYSGGDPCYLYRYDLGGGAKLRGYYNNRFRGKKFYLTQGEYRLAIIKNISFVLFAELGDITDSNFKSAKKTYGYGLRFGLPPDYLMKLRFDYGISEDQSGLFVIFGEVF